MLRSGTAFDNDSFIQQKGKGEFRVRKTEMKKKGVTLCLNPSMNTEPIQG